MADVVAEKAPTMLSELFRVHREAGATSAQALAVAFTSDPRFIGAIQDAIAEADRIEREWTGKKGARPGYHHSAADALLQILNTSPTAGKLPHPM